MLLHLSCKFHTKLSFLWLKSQVNDCEPKLVLKKVLTVKTSSFEPLFGGQFTFFQLRWYQVKWCSLPQRRRIWRLNWIFLLGRFKTFEFHRFRNCNCKLSTLHISWIFSVDYSMMVRVNILLLLLFLCFTVNGEPIIGEVRCLAFNFTPTGFLKADGQLLSISQYVTLFSLLGKF